MSVSRAVVALVTALVVAGCGGDGDDGAAGKLVWDGEPRILRPPTLPDDRILRGTLMNESRRTVELQASDVQLIDAAGKPIDASVIFLEAYVKPLESRNRPSQETEGERRRRGLAVVLRAGERAPLTLSWRERGGRSAERIVYGRGSLPVR